MNLVVQTITLCADPELKTYNGGEGNVVSFNAAVNKKFKKEGQPTADFFRYVAFGKTAELICKYCKKGDHLVIHGEINNNNYEKDGVMQYRNQIKIDSIDFMGKKPDSRQPTEGEILDNLNADDPYGGSESYASDSYAESSYASGGSESYSAYSDF